MRRFFRKRPSNLDPEYLPPLYRLWYALNHPPTNTRRKKAF